jgi:hypothetical protein
MKKEVLLLVFILFATAVYADCDVTDTFNKTASRNYTIDDKDYIIKFSSLKDDSGDISVKFSVNGVSTPDLDEGTKHTFSDLSDITISSISMGAVDTAQICFNAGLSGLKGTCSSDKDCDNGNPCTIDECEGDPLRCHRLLILWCRDDDGCCPSRCDNEKDNDCEIVVNETTAAETRCLSDSDCDDDNSITKDTCNTTVRRCSHTTIVDCISGDDYCPVDCTFTLDTDCDMCLTDDECDDNNACTSDSCSGSPKNCSYTVTPGCNFNKTCITIGTWGEDYFCSEDNVMKPLKSRKEPCYNDYECLSEKCVKNKCKAQNIFKKISSWVMGLFGR